MILLIPLFVTKPISIDPVLNLGQIKTVLVNPREDSNIVDVGYGLISNDGSVVGYANDRLGHSWPCFYLNSGRELESTFVLSPNVTRNEDVISWWTPVVMLDDRKWVYAQTSWSTTKPSLTKTTIAVSIGSRPTEKPFAAKYTSFTIKDEARGVANPWQYANGTASVVEVQKVPGHYRLIRVNVRAKDSKVTYTSIGTLPSSYRGKQLKVLEVSADGKQALLVQVEGGFLEAKHGYYLWSHSHFYPSQNGARLWKGGTIVMTKDGIAILHPGRKPLIAKGFDWQANDPNQKYGLVLKDHNLYLLYFN